MTQQTHTAGALKRWILVTIGAATNYSIIVTMDGEAGALSGRSQKEKKRSHRYLEEPEEPSTKRPYKLFQVPKDSINRMRQNPDNSGSEPALCGAESSDFLPFYVCVSQDGWGDGGEDKCPVYLNEELSMADCSLTSPVTPVTHRPCLFVPAPSSVTTIASTMSSVACPSGSSPMLDTCSAISSMYTPTGSPWDTLRSTSGSPSGSDGDPVSAAAHLHLLGESLSLIGNHLQETNKTVCVSRSLSLLLDSLLCALAPLICLTVQIPELKSCTQHTLASTLENIGYLMPGL